MEEGKCVVVAVFPILGEPAAAVEPGEGALDDPALRQRDEAFDVIGAVDDLGFEMREEAGQGALKDRPLVGAVGEQFSQEGKQSEQGRERRDTTVAILHIGGGDEAVEKQALRIDQNMALLAFDQLARVEAGWIDASPPFSALFTLWLSMMQAVGLASSSAFSRHLT